MGVMMLGLLFYLVTSDLKLTLDGLQNLPQLVVGEKVGLVSFLHNPSHNLTCLQDFEFLSYS